MLGTDPGRLHDPAEEPPRLGHLDPGAERAGAVGAHGDQAHLPVGEVGGIREEREDLLGRAEDLRRVLEGGRRRAQLRTRSVRESLRCARWRRSTSCCWVPRASSATGSRWRSTRARRWRCWPCSRSPTARGRATCSPSCCGPSTTPSTRAGALRRTLSALRSAIGAELRGRHARPGLARAGAGVLRGRRPLPRRSREGGDMAGAAALFRGEFLEGFGLRDAPGFDDWQRGEADELRRELATVLARLVEATGDVAVAQRWLELDPLHEPAHRALIRLHAERGDRAAALAQYRECVRTLSRELGVPPLAETTRLYEAISEGTFEAPAAADGRSQHRRPWFLRPRRSSAAAASGRRWSSAYEGVAADGRAVLLEGEAGIGKTRLAEELVAHARERGAAVLAGRAYEEEAALAYGPLVEALRRRLRDDDAWVAGVTDRALREAARLLPDLSAAPPPPLDGPAAQARFLDGVWETLAAAAAAGPAPGLLVVDDVQWADEATLGLLTYGLRRLGGRRLLVLLTSRAPLRRVPAAGDRARAAGRGRRRRAAARAPAPRASSRRGSTRRPRGCRSCSSSTSTRSAPIPDWALPAGARELLLARLDPVSETGRQVLAAAAAIGRSFDVETVRAASGRGDEETVSALEELVRPRAGARGSLRLRLRPRAAAAAGGRGDVARAAAAAARAGGGRAGRPRGGDRPPPPARRPRRRGGGRVPPRRRARALAVRQRRGARAPARRARGRRPRAGLAALPPSATCRRSRATTAPRSPPTRRRPPSPPPPSSRGIEHRLGQVRHRRGEWALATAHFEAALAATPEDDLAARARITADLSLSAHDGGDPCARRVARRGAPARWPSRPTTRARSARPTTCSARSRPAAARRRRARAPAPLARARRGDRRPGRPRRRAQQPRARPPRAGRARAGARADRRRARPLRRPGRPPPRGGAAQQPRRPPARRRPPRGRDGAAQARGGDLRRGRRGGRAAARGLEARPLVSGRSSRRSSPPAGQHGPRRTTT